MASLPGPSTFSFDIFGRLLAVEIITVPICFFSFLQLVATPTFDVNATAAARCIDRPANSNDGPQRNSSIASVYALRSLPERIPYDKRSVVLGTTARRSVSSNKSLSIERIN